LFPRQKSRFQFQEDAKFKHPVADVPMQLRVPRQN